MLFNAFTLFTLFRDLIEMMSIGTLLAYTLVTMCVLDLRYQPTTLVDEQPVVGHRLNAASHIEENGGRSGLACRDTLLMKQMYLTSLKTQV